ncbi:MAG: ABC transporter permease [Sedimentisphaerales bacterium]|nr:ABC transporter permease [Sedimentisphaerales bacterium]
MKAVLAIPFAFFRLFYQSVYLALGQIWANKVRSILTTTGIVIGVASVTSVIAALTGLKANVLSSFESLGTNKIFIVPRWPREGRFKNASWRVIRFRPQQFDGLRERCPSIDDYTLMAEQGDTIYYGVHDIEDARVYGINPSWHRIENRSVIMGRPFSLMDEENGWQVCLITPKVRDELRMDRNCIGKRIVIGQRSFTVVGVVETRVESSMFGQMGSSEEVFIPFPTAWKLWDPWIYAIASCRKPELSEEAQAELRFFLRQARRLGPGDPDTFRMEVIEEYLKGFNAIAMTTTAIAGGVVGISLLVGGIGIMNIMLVSVSERTREIGLRKAVGAKPSAILFQFLVESVVLCLFGGLIGAGLGQGLTWLIGKIPGASLDKAYIPLWALGLSFGFAAGVGVFFGMFPAVKAARLDPIEALRHE